MSDQQQVTQIQTPVDENQRVADKLYGGEDNKVTETTSADPSLSRAPENEAADTGKESGEATDQTQDPVEQTKVVPEKYELKLPEGASMDQAAVEKFSAFAKEQGLTQDQAQKVLESQNEVVKGYIAQQKQEIEAKDKQWGAQLLADPDYGGANLEENGKLAYNTAARWFGDEFATLLKDQKLNQHPAIFKGLVRIAKASANDKFVGGGSHKPATTVEERFYGKAE